MLTDFLVSKGIQFFASGWTQFAAAFGMAFIIMIVFGRTFVRFMHKIQGKGQPISENVPLEHQKKAGTPSMGGILILIATIVLYYFGNSVTEPIKMIENQLNQMSQGLVVEKLALERNDEIGQMKKLRNTNKLKNNGPTIPTVNL